MLHLIYLVSVMKSGGCPLNYVLEIVYFEMIMVRNSIIKSDLAQTKVIFYS